MEAGSNKRQPPAIPSSSEEGNSDHRRTFFDGSSSENGKEHIGSGGDWEESMKYAVIFEKTKTGYSAHVPDLPGCVAAARTLKSTEKLMREAIELHLESMKEHGEVIPPPVTEAGYIAVPREY